MRHQLDGLDRRMVVARDPSRARRLERSRARSARRPEKRSLINTLEAGIAGDKEGEWNRWYRRAIPEAARLYSEYLRETGQR
jgi:hypothetical protein